MRTTISAFILGITILAVPLAVHSQKDCVWGNGQMVTRDRTPAPFHRLHTNGIYEMDIVCGKPQQVTISAESNILPFIITEVTDGTLFIQTRRSICPTADIHLTIHVNRLDRLDAGGSSVIHVSGVDIRQFELNARGAVDVDVSGKTVRFHANLEGAANVNGTDLDVIDAKVQLTGAADAHVHVRHRLEANLSGSGDLYCLAKPEQLDVTNSGTGDLVVETDDNEGDPRTPLGR